MTTTTQSAVQAEQPVRPIIIDNNIWLKACQIARARNHRSGIDPEPRLPITTAKLYKDVRAGLVPKPTKFGQSSAWRWGDIMAAYGLSAEG